MTLASRVGEIVLLDFPYTNYRGSKVRPALIVSEKDLDSSTGDLIVAYITTETDAYAFSSFAVVFDNGDLETGRMKKASAVRLDKTIPIQENQIFRHGVAKLKAEKVAEALKAWSKLVTINYYRGVHRPAQTAPFIPHESRIPYAGRVFDEREITNLIDASLDFWLTTGRYAEEFEEKFAKFFGVKYCSLVNSGSSANLLAFMALTSPKLGNRRIIRGDEVITVAAGFPTTVAPIIQYGAAPVFVDVELTTGNIDCTQLEAALSPKTRAVMLAHTLGNPFDVKRVKDFCSRHGLWLIEDNCDALGSRCQINGQWHYTGSFGDLGSSSFYPPHHITMGEGGAVYTNNTTLKRLVESFRDWGRDCWCPPGRDNTCGKRFGQQFGELPPGYDHKYVYSHFGYNLKATDLQAAIGCAQLEKLPDFIEARRRNWNLLHQGLADLSDVFILPEPTPNSDPSWFGFLLTVREDAGFTRDEIVAHLESSGIQTRMLFAGNLTKHPCFDELRATHQGYRIVGQLTNTDTIMHHSFWLGVYPGLSEAMIAYMVEQIRRGVKGEG